MEIKQYRPREGLLGNMRIEYEGAELGTLVFFPSWDDIERFSQRDFPRGSIGLRLILHS